MKLLKEPLLHFLIVGGILFGRLTLARRQQSSGNRQHLHMPARLALTAAWTNLVQRLTC
jgi:hypothetical protein